MIIVGAKGFAKEVLEIVHQNNELEGLAFFDDVNHDIPDLLFRKFPILKNEDEVREHFMKFGNNYTIGIGGPLLRKKMYDKFVKLSGNLNTIISKFSEIGSYGVEIGEGCNILSGAILANSVKLGKANIIYYNAIITHDVSTGDFVEISPGAKLLGRCAVGDFSSIGSSAVILPDVKVGRNVIVGAGAIVTKDLPDNCVAVGNPAKIISTNND
ncbi:NeuD/PglB/VioB family sugar acetyltransferase [Chryseobacterium sp. MP_3.2]|uniref:NeuD/PglB/VioB family sugar acetyltransferase n=1 Tax=Chryseobacterium sp. MP_3.2 TaxID=3071712 RepID=UPI002E05E86D|nr:sugar O-acyltransferase (sialic acid O-acetyltransferase NeuD family) [Chryseobacterium sp. MP_3.2]